MKKLAKKKQVVRQWFSNPMSLWYKSLDGKKHLADRFTLEEICNLFDTGYKFFCMKREYAGRAETVFEQKVWNFLLFDGYEVYPRPLKSRTRAGKMLHRIGNIAESVAAYILAMLLGSALWGGAMAIFYVLLCLNPRLGARNYYEGLIQCVWVPLIVGFLSVPCTSLTKYRDKKYEERKKAAAREAKEVGLEALEVCYEEE